MTRQQIMHECFLGGPGLRAYAFQATLYCPACARGIAENLPQSILDTISGTADDLFSDSETLPQPCFFPESDMAQYCDACGKYLYGPLDEEP